MGTVNGNKRRISAHKLPISLPRPGALLSERAPQAAFLVQLLGTGASISDAQANHSYRAAEASATKRIPTGYRKSVSI